jgi:hypothetical protein
MSPARTEPGPLAGVRVTVAVRADDGWLYLAPAGTHGDAGGWVPLAALAGPWRHLSRFGVWHAELPGEIVATILDGADWAALIAAFTTAATRLAAPAARTGEDLCDLAHPGLPSEFAWCTARRGHEPAWHAMHSQAAGEPLIMWEPLGG